MKIPVNKDEVLRYLGYKGQTFDDIMIKLIDKSREEVKEKISPKYIYRYFNIDIKDNGVYLEGTNLVLEGEDITNHLKDSKECVLMVATLGNEIERTTRYYEKSNLTKAIIVDSCATTAVEEVCDYVETLIKDECDKRNKNITFRFSPGYGDLPLDIQIDFIKVMDATRKIGVMASEHNILFPRKSVTAIIGVIDKDIEIQKRSCKDCNNYERCRFRKEGIGCGI